MKYDLRGHWWSHKVTFLNKNPLFLRYNFCLKYDLCMNANIYTQNTEMNNWVSIFANHFAQIDISNIYMKLLIFYQDTFGLTTTIFVQNSIFVFIFLKKLSFTTLTWLKTTQLNNDAFLLKSIKKFTFCVKSSDTILFLLGLSPIN